MKHYHFSKSDTSIAKLIAITLMLLHHLFGFTDRILPENMYQSLYMFRGPVSYTHLTLPTKA